MFKWFKNSFFVTCKYATFKYHSISILCFACLFVCVFFCFSAHSQTHSLSHWLMSILLYRPELIVGSRYSAHNLTIFTISPYTGRVKTKPNQTMLFVTGQICILIQAFYTVIARES